MSRKLILGIVAAALATAAWPAFAFSQEQPKALTIEREKLFLAGWDPDEPVPAYIYYQKGKEALPVVIFVHGLGGSKDAESKRVQELAGKGFFVIAIDAHLHGERKVPGMFFKNFGKLSEDYPIWVHQSAISHTSRDISKIIDHLSVRTDVDRERIGLVGISMGSCTCLVTAWREPRISAAVCIIGAVDHWYDVTKTPPGPEQDAKRNALSPRVKQLVNSINSRDHMAALAPKALFFANGAKDDGIDIQTVKSFVKDLQPSYAAYPDRLAFLEEPDLGHSVTDRMWTEGTKWLLRHLVEKPIRSPR
jgi:dienelactone hydrolase